MWPWRFVSITLLWLYEHRCWVTLAEVGAGSYLRTGAARWASRTGATPCRAVCSGLTPSAQRRTTWHPIYPLWAVLHWKPNSCIPSDTTCHHRHECTVSVTPQQTSFGCRFWKEKCTCRFYAPEWWIYKAHVVLRCIAQMLIPEDKTGVKRNQSDPTAAGMFHIWLISRLYV